MLGSAAQRADQSQRCWTLTEIVQFYDDYFSKLTLSVDSTLILLNKAQDGLEGGKVVQSFSDEETGQPLSA